MRGDELEGNPSFAKHDCSCEPPLLHERQRLSCSASNSSVTLTTSSTSVSRRLRTILQLSHMILDAKM